MIRKYDPPLLLEPSWVEMVFGLSNRTKEINEEMIRERKMQHYNIATEQMSILCGELTKDLDKADYLKRNKLSSLPSILDSDRNTAKSSDITKIIIEYDIFLSSVNGKCEMIYGTVVELRKLIPKKDLTGGYETINSFEEFAKDIQMKLEAMKKELTDLLEKSLIEEDEIMKREQREQQEYKNKGKKTFGDFKQDYVKETGEHMPNDGDDSNDVPPRRGAKLSTSGNNSIEIFKGAVVGPPPLLKTKDIPEWSSDNKTLFQQIKKTYRKLAVKYHPDKNDDPDAEEIFKNISSLYDMIEKDPEFSKFAGKSKKQKKKKQTKKAKKKKQTKKGKKKS